MALDTALTRFTLFPFFFFFSTIYFRVQYLNLKLNLSQTE